MPIPTMQNSEQRRTTIFARQLEYYQLAYEQLSPATVALPLGAEAMHLHWSPKRSDLQPLRVERDHIAVFAMRHLVLLRGQKVVLSGPRQERAALLIEHLQMEAGAEFVLMMPSDLLVAHCQSIAQEGNQTRSAAIRLLAPAGADGEHGVDGSRGSDGCAALVAGSAGGGGGAANCGKRGEDACDALLSIGCLDGDFLFESRGGVGGNGGNGGKGGKGGQGGVDRASRTMGIGGPGGPGCSGAVGGAGGNGGVLRVRIQALASGAEYTLLPSKAAGGAGGAGGRGGIPGLGHPDGCFGSPGADGDAGADGLPGTIDLHLLQ